MLTTTTNNCTELLSPIYIRPSQAKLFGLSKSHMWSLIKNQDIPSYLPTKKLRLIKVIDLIMYIENTKINDTYDENKTSKVTKTTNLSNKTCSLNQNCEINNKKYNVQKGVTNAK